MYEQLADDEVETTEERLAAEQAARRRNMEIACTIQQQIGKRALFMIGARNFIASERTLSFKIQCRGSRANYVAIKLEWNDTYTMTFEKVSTRGRKLVARNDDVYFDQLCEMIEQATGLVTSL